MLQSDDVASLREGRSFLLEGRKVEDALANNSLIDTRSSSPSSLEMNGEVPPGRSDSLAQACPP